MEQHECYELGLRHGEALTAPAARLRAVPIDDLGAAAWKAFGDDYYSSTWEEERDVHKDSDEDEKDSTPYARTCQAAEAVRARLVTAVEAENPAAAPSRAVLVAVRQLAAAFEPDGDPRTAGAAAAGLCKAIGGRAGAWLATLLAGQEVRARGDSTRDITHAELVEIAADLPRPLFDGLGRACWGVWTKRGKREVMARVSLLAELQKLADVVDDAGARDGALELMETIVNRPDKMPHLITSDTGTRILLFSRHNFVAAGVGL